ncbi:conserved hypothetical protein [Microsporum canis CBS 113480]|uniref:Uncharacterized protein n=1 Tax=Arthroderma otae (strain ATCC MYA-4605 / CBS 113480) TaxID=554155 RepID=C5FP26_ARTOC|nr:conserved hypothetical protein [Microsporum canis CBS 113480]EEQ31879.1 conserved hypothetical protein [Microsporum canis CBS 113480]
MSASGYNLQSTQNSVSASKAMVSTLVHMRLLPGSIYYIIQQIDGSRVVSIYVSRLLFKAGRPGNRVLLRLPLPYKVEEVFRPGNVDEKLRCEAGTYTWLQENHGISIPRLYEFVDTINEDEYKTIWMELTNFSTG